MSNSIAPGSSADVNIKVTALTTNPNVPVTYKTIILKKNLVNGVNTLTQEMMFAENIKYVIKYDYILGENITVPYNCILEFDGGSISGNFIITGQNTYLSNNIKCYVSLSGTFNNKTFNALWFGANHSPLFDNTKIFRNLVNVCRENKINLYIPKGEYYLLNGNFDLGIHLDNVLDIDNYIDFNNIKIYGDNRNTIIKSSYIADIFNIYNAKNLTIEGFSVCSILEPNSQSNEHGTNNISIINAENITINNIYSYDGYYKDIDGGKGITLQGQVFNNIQINNVDVYNCIYGIDVSPTGYFSQSEKSLIRLNNILVRKCYIGVINTSYTDIDIDSEKQIIKGGKIHGSYKIENCYISYNSDSLVGVFADVLIENTESVENLHKAPSNTEWTNRETTSKLVSFNDGYNSNIRVNAYAKETNYGLYINSRSKLGLKNLNLSLHLNDNINIVKSLYSQEFTTEDVYYVTSIGFSRMSNVLFEININKEFEYSVPQNSVFIINGDISCKNVNISNEITIKKIIGIKPNGKKGEGSIIQNDDGSFHITNKVSNTYQYKQLTFGSPDTPNFGFNGIGEILERELMPNSNITTDGIGYITLKDIDNVNDIKGRIIIAPHCKSVGSTTDRTALDSTILRVGFRFFDTTLGKPVYVKDINGIKVTWIDATGTIV